MTERASPSSDQRQISSPHEVGESERPGWNGRLKEGEPEGKRGLVFDSFDDVLDEAERLAAAPHVRVLGEWTLGQILEHVARVMDASIDGTKGRAPWPMRLAMVFLGRRMLRSLDTGMLPAGYKIPKELQPDFLPPAHVPTAAGLEHLQRSIERLQTEDHRAPHVAFGTIPREQYDLLQRRHAAMHFGFVIPMQ